MAHLPEAQNSGGKPQTCGVSRLGWEEMTPLEIDENVPQDKAINAPRPLNGAEGSFLSDANVPLDAWKEAQDGDGTIMRFLNLSGRPGEVNVTTPLMDIKPTWLCDAMEANQGEILNINRFRGPRFFSPPRTA